MGKTRTKLVEEGKKPAKDAPAVKRLKKAEDSGGEEQKVSKKIPVGKGCFNILANPNNTIVAFGDKQGNILAQASAGAAGFKNTKKGTPYAGAKAMELLLNKIGHFEISEAKVILKGIGPGREAAVRVLFNRNLNLTEIEDRTPIPFGGPTPKKRRRV